MIFIHALGRKVAELMSNTSQQRLEIPEHTGREVDTSGLQAGKGKPCLVGVKSFAHFDEFMMFKNDNR